MSAQGIPAEGSKVLRTYIINQTSHWFITGLIFPVLVLLVLDKGLDIFEAGTVMAIYSGAAVLLELPTGGLADSIGRKKVYLLSVAVHMVAVLIFLLSFNYATVALAALIMGTGRALSSGSMDAWFVDEYKKTAPGANLQAALARANMIIPIGLGVGSLVGGFLPMALGGYLNSTFGATIFAANLLVVLVADTIQLAVTNAIVVEAPMTKGGGLWDGFRKTPEVISTSVQYGVKNRTTLVLLLVMMAFGFGITGLELLWQPRVSEILGTEAQTWVLGVLAAAYFMVTSVGNAIATPLCTRAKNDYLLVMTGLFMLLGLLLVVLALQNGIILFAVLYLTVYTVLGMTDSPYTALYNEQVPTEQRSTMLSFRSLLLQGGGLTGSVVLGYVAQASGIPTAWTISAAVVALSSVGFIYLRARAVPAEKKEPLGSAP